MVESRNKKRKQLNTLKFELNRLQLTLKDRMGFQVKLKEELKFTLEKYNALLSLISALEKKQTPLSNVQSDIISKESFKLRDKLKEDIKVLQSRKNSGAISQSTLHSEIKKHRQIIYNLKKDLWHNK